MITREQQLSIAFISLLVSITPSRGHLVSDEFWPVESIVVWKPLHISGYSQLSLFSVSLFWGCGGTRREKYRQSRAAFCKISIKWYYKYQLILIPIIDYFPILPVIGRSVTTFLTVPVMIKKKICLSRKIQNQNPKSTTHENLLLYWENIYPKPGKHFLQNCWLNIHFLEREKKKGKKLQQQCLELIKWHWAQERGITTRRESDTKRTTLVVCLVHRSLEQKLKPLYDR